MIKKAFCALALLLFLASAGYSQQSNTYKQTLIKMMEVSGSAQTFKASIDGMIKIFKSQKPDVPQEVWTEFEDTFVKSASLELVDMLLPVYQNHMTEADLKNLIIFYQTPTGKRFAEKSPLIIRDSMQVGQEWGARLGQVFAERLKEKGYSM
jgi:hypothetical protein